MRSLRLPLLITLITAPLAAAALAAVPTAQAHDAMDRFEVSLDPLNQPGEGTVRLDTHEGELAVRLKAKDLDDGIHLAHLHGIRQAENECPTLAADGDGNGLVDLIEGLPAYGPVQRTLSDGLNDTGTRIEYRRVFATLDNGDPISALGDLSQYAVVVHGVDLDGDGLATNPDADGDGTADANPSSDNEISMPALCGTVEPR